MRDLSAESFVIFKHHRNAQFEYVASRKGYRIVWTETKVVRHIASDIHPTTEEAWEDAASRIEAKQ